MFNRQSYSAILITICVSFCACHATSDDDLKETQSPESNLTYLDSVIYGLVEGVTEFLPISSTGHLVIVSEFANLDGEEAKIALHAYLIVIQAGAILAVGLIYRKEIWSMVLGFLGMDPRGRRLGFNLILAFLPAALVGPFLDDLIEAYLFGLLPIAIALFAGALFMHWAESRKKRMEGQFPAKVGKSLDDLTWKSSFFIGFLQCFAMCPGTSRSMMTIVGGYLVGLDRSKAAEFSFLLGLITLTAAACYKSVTKWSLMSQHLALGPVLLGCLVALGCRIIGLTGISGQTDYGRNVDNPTPSFSGHGTTKTFNPMKATGQVGAYDVFPIILLHAKQEVVPCNARIVDQHVNAFMLCQQVLASFSNFLSGRDVNGFGRGTSTDLRNRFRSRSARAL